MTNRSFAVLLALGTGNPILSHIGSRFVIVDGATAQVIASDDTLLAHDVPVEPPDPGARP